MRIALSQENFPLIMLHYVILFWFCCYDKEENENNEV